MALHPLLMTAIISAVAIVLGVPVAIVTILYNNNWVPHLILGTKTVKVGRHETREIDFGILTGPQDAVYISALVSLASTALFITGAILIRHFTRHNAFGWLAFGPALLNLLASAGCCAAVWLFHRDYPTATSTDQIQYVNGTYDTHGKLYTKESWSCSMNALYAEREGHWASQACSHFEIARVLTVPLAVCAIGLFALAHWQVRQRGGFGWLFGRRDRIIAAYAPKEEYVDLEATNGRSSNEAWKATLNRERRNPSKY